MDENYTNKMYANAKYVNKKYTDKKCKRNLECEVYKRIKSTKYAISDVPYHEFFSCKLYE